MFYLPTPQELLMLVYSEWELEQLTHKLLANYLQLL